MLAASFMKSQSRAQEERQSNKEVAVDESRLGAAADMSCLCEVALRTNSKDRSPAAI